MVVSVKLAIGLLCVLSGLLLTRSKHLVDSNEKWFNRALFAVWLLSRLSLFVIVYVLSAMEPASDVSAYYWPQARMAARGMLVYSDFRSSYAPLFPYVLAVATWIWSSPKVIVVFAIAAEGVSLPFWRVIATQLLSERRARIASVLYVTSALPLVNVALEGQNQVYVSLLFAVALWSLVRGRSRLAGVVLSASVVAVKFLPLVALPAFLTKRASRRSFGLAFVALPLVVYGALALKGVDVLMPVRMEGTDQTSGGLPFVAAGVLSMLGGAVPSVLLDMVTLLVLGCVSVYLMTRRFRIPALGTLWSLVLMFTTLLLVSKKAYTSYLVMSFYPFCVIESERFPSWKSALSFGLFGMAAMIERTLWFRWLDARPLGPAIAGLGYPNWMLVVVFVTIECFLLATYVRLWWAARRQIQQCCIEEALTSQGPVPVGLPA
jgi:hypothetical protein